MNTFVRFSLAIAASIASLAAAAADKDGVSRNDREFVEKAARAGMAEVQAAKIAGQKAEAQAVKDFARHLEEDHTRANEELEKLARSKSLGLPEKLDRKHERALDALGKRSAARFQREYLKKQVSDHRSAIREFEHESKRGGDPELRKWASDQLPTLRRHLEMARAALKALD